jgi:hypothetical protein
MLVSLYPVERAGTENHFLTVQTILADLVHTKVRALAGEAERLGSKTHCNLYDVVAMLRPRW